VIARARLIAVLAALVAGAIGIISSTQTWIDVILTAGSAPDIAVAGNDAVPVLAPLSLAALALGLALSIVWRILRYVFGALALAGAVWLFILTLQVVTGPPVAAVAAPITKATGIAGSAAIAALIDHAVVSGWAWGALFGWVLLAVSGAFTLATAHRWRTGGRRYETSTAVVAATGPLDAVDSWDSLSRGDDPTDAGRAAPEDEDETTRLDGRSHAPEGGS